MSRLTDWFEWNGVKCTELGIHVSEHPAITLPAERVTFTDIPGRSGALTTLQGDDVYDDMILSATCFVTDMSRWNEIASYLRGSGKVTFANRQGGFYYARIINQIPFDQVMRARPNRTFTVNFRCKPFFYLNDSSPVTLTSSGSFIHNPGLVASEPIVTINALGPVTLLVGMTITDIDYVPNTIVLDTPLQEAYLNRTTWTSLNSIMTGDFPKLGPGNNAISWIGNVSSIIVEPNWRTL